MEQKPIKILHLPLKAKWYDMQERGEKTEEYREITPYWCKRLLVYQDTVADAIAFRKDYTHVCFRYGYTKRCMVRRIDEITIGRGNPEWGAPTDRDVFIIKHHKEPSPFFGFELNKEYFDKAQRRIDNERRQLTLF